MEMQQLQAFQTPCFTQHFNQLQNLRGRQTEFGFLAAAGLPFTGALRGKTCTHTQTWDHVQTFGFFQHQFNLSHLLDNQIYLVTELLTDQRQTNIFAVFIAVTHDHGTGHPGVRQNGHQFSFRAGFQTQRFTGFHQRFDHAAMLVNLNRINQEVVTLITERFTRTFERRVNRTQTVLQNLWETEQCRQTLTVLLTHVFHQLCQINTGRRLVRIRADTDVAQFVDVKIVVTPIGNVVSAQHLAGITIVHGNLLHGAQRNSIARV
ncbi:hypothetical protein SRABI106_01834 [Rahnella aquatilis]|nr:hypothetical protein SRABI106_01834 [Rahnella aquatilis]